MFSFFPCSKQGKDCRLSLIFKQIFKPIFGLHLKNIQMIQLIPVRIQRQYPIAKDENLICSILLSHSLPNLQIVGCRSDLPKPAETEKIPYGYLYREAEYVCSVWIWRQRQVRLGFLALLPHSPATGAFYLRPNLQSRALSRLRS